VHLYMPVKPDDRLPEIGVFVPVVDVKGEILIMRNMGDGWNWRDSVGINTPNTNEVVDYWLEKV
ncbi:MAG: hypothetical protein WCL06_09705, partial [Bacteroidota bacterium]